jgi:hypothetical protein
VSRADELKLTVAPCPSSPAGQHDRCAKNRDNFDEIWKKSNDAIAGTAPIDRRTPLSIG